MKRARARAARAMTIAMRVVGEEDGEGGKAIALATRVVGEWMATATKRAMATKMREAGKDDGNCKGGKTNGEGKKDGNSKQQ
jgi:hypothetical protein